MKTITVACSKKVWLKTSTLPAWGFVHYNIFNFGIHISTMAVPILTLLITCMTSQKLQFEILFIFFFLFYTVGTILAAHSAVGLLDDGVGNDQGRTFFPCLRKN